MLESKFERFQNLDPTVMSQGLPRAKYTTKGSNADWWVGGLVGWWVGGLVGW